MVMVELKYNYLKVSTTETSLLKTQHESLIWILCVFPPITIQLRKVIIDVYNIIVWRLHIQVLSSNFIKYKWNWVPCLDICLIRFAWSVCMYLDGYLATGTKDFVKFELLHFFLTG